MQLPPNPLRPLVQKLPRPLRNRYFFVSVAFVLWLLLFDRHDFITQLSLQDSIEKLESDKLLFQQKIEQARKEKSDLENYTERYARERYFMSRSHEDVFIIKE